MKGYGNYPSIFHCMTVNYNRFYFESRDREWFSLPSGLTTRSAESLAACDNYVCLRNSSCCWLVARQSYQSCLIALESRCYALKSHQLAPPIENRNVEEQLYSWARLTCKLQLNCNCLKTFLLSWGGANWWVGIVRSQWNPVLQLCSGSRGVRTCVISAPLFAFLLVS